GKGLVLPRDRSGVIERRRETGAAQRLPHRGGTGETARERAVLARNEKRKARIPVAERPLDAVEFPGFEEMRLHRVVVHREEKISRTRGSGAARELRHEAVVADEHRLQSVSARGGFDLHGEIAV